MKESLASRGQAPGRTGETDLGGLRAPIGGQISQQGPLLLYSSPQWAPGQQVCDRQEGPVPHGGGGADLVSGPTLVHVILFIKIEIVKRILDQHSYSQKLHEYRPRCIDMVVYCESPRRDVRG